MKFPWSSKPTVEVRYVKSHPEDRKSSGGSKYGNISFNKDFSFSDQQQRRDISRAVTKESLTARALLKRLTDNVVNTGMTWESTPLWDMITDAPDTKEAKRQWTVDIENMLKLYADSTESDINNSMTFGKMQRLVFELGLGEGEAFIVLRYLSDPRRISSVTGQIINNDQISTPYDGTLQADIKKRGAKVVDGVEFDSVGREVAIWVQPGLTEKHVRLQYFGATGRRLVIHYNPGKKNGESRGVPEMASLSYELSRMTEVEINEIEKSASASTWMGVVETDKDNYVKRPDFLVDSDSTESEQSQYTPGIDTVKVGDKSLIMNNLEPGQEFKMFKSDYTNTNLEPLLDTYQTRVSGAMGLSLAFLKNKYDSNYTAARATILFDWNNILVRRDDIINGFLYPFIEAVITEWENDGEIKAPGYDSSKKTRLAWLRGIWNGTNRPAVDPVKEATSSEKRRMLGDTTGEREAKAFNGSDWRENVSRLKDENELLADANEPLQRQDNTTISESIIIDQETEGKDD